MKNRLYRKKFVLEDGFDALETKIPKTHLPICFIVTLILSVIISVVISLYVFRFAIVDGDSMQPTLNSNDIVAIYKMPHKFERFDIVVIESPNELIVKRIMGLPGETVQILDGCVYINGEQLDDVMKEPITSAGSAAEPITLGVDEYFVLGDNRDVSMDSRNEYIGIIKEEQIIGRLIFSLIPPKGLK